MKANFADDNLEDELDSANLNMERARREASYSDSLMSLSDSDVNECRRDREAAILNGRTRNKNNAAWKDQSSSRYRDIALIDRRRLAETHDAEQRRSQSTEYQLTIRAMGNPTGALAYTSIDLNE